MITHAASRKQYTVLLDRPEGELFVASQGHTKNFPLPTVFLTGVVL